ncbi:O-antigen ligase family protein [Bacillus sp. 37MA]|uniref:O-antigen ligase family protein n=1 Tax=Bacillus sp. 37MA TaxID=1132442 RepID=UPI0003677985|nr:O-antigen ligase family protein [Bacillus sp. 37MA]
MDETINYKENLISLQLLKSLFALIIIMTFFAPNLLGRDYLGITTLFASLIIVLLYEKIIINKLTILIFVYVIFTIFVDLISNFNYPTSPVFIVRTFIYSLVPLVAFILGSFFNNRLNENSVNKLILITGFGQALIGLAQVYNESFRAVTLNYYANFEKYNYGFEAWEVGRIVGTIGNPNIFGVFLVIFSIYILTILLPKYQNNIKYTFILIIILLTSSYAILLSQSRTAYLLLALGIVASILLSKKNILIKSILLSLILLVLALIYINNPIVSRRFEAENIDTLGGREDIWRIFIKNYLSPFTIQSFVGYGFYYVRDISKAVDNYYLQLILQYGFIGLLLYLNIFLSAIKSFLFRARVSKYSAFIIISTITILISDFTGTINMSPDISIFYFLILGYCFNK